MDICPLLPSAPPPGKRVLQGHWALVTGGQEWVGGAVSGVGVLYLGEKCYFCPAVEET